MRRGERYWLWENELPNQLKHIDTNKSILVINARSRIWIEVICIDKDGHSIKETIRRRLLRNSPYELNGYIKRIIGFKKELMEIDGDVEK